MKLSNAEAYWAMTSSEALSQLQSRATGLTTAEASARAKTHGPNVIKSHEKVVPLYLLLNQFRNPIMIILITATVISGLTGDLINSLIILAIVVASVVLSFLQEYKASNAMDELRSRVQLQSAVWRDSELAQVASHILVPGDIVKLSAGSLIAADGLVIECDDFFVNQSILTGEAFPVEKHTLASATDSSLTERANCVYSGTVVYSGSAKMLVVRTGVRTEFGRIAGQLAVRPPETEFERGVRGFGNMLTQIMLILTLSVFGINVLLDKPAIDSLLFSVALAVGITPQLLPAIISVTLSQGSQKMASEGVIVRRLSSMENFGSMDVLCTDKTGTLTEGIVRLNAAVDTQGNECQEVFELAYLNAHFQTGLVNALDEAIVASGTMDIGDLTKQDEIPYDFSRKRLSIIVKNGYSFEMITKGALMPLLDICPFVKVGTLEHSMDPETRSCLEERFTNWSAQGYRVLGVARKAVAEKTNYPIADETAMTLVGFLLFFDPPKEGVAETIAELSRLGVTLRIITGDNRQVAMHVAKSLGIAVQNPLTGADLMRLNEDALWNVIEAANLFSEVDPNQKERIILALKKRGHVVGYMGDGINDAPALHAADVSISVNTAVDVAREAADFVLLEKSLSVLRRGIELGRVTFVNTRKYINITTSANFGNMISMAGISLFMPYLPLLPMQILLLNLLSDFPALALARDTVDREMVDRPSRWDVRYIRRFMLVFGLISSAFDLMAFAVFLLGFRLQEAAFQTGWFTLSVLTELVVLTVMRTRKPFFLSRPAPILLYSSAGVALLSLLLPYLPFSRLLNLQPVAPAILFSLLAITATYALVTEAAKHFFFRVPPDS